MRSRVTKLVDESRGGNLRKERKKIVLEFGWQFQFIRQCDVSCELGQRYSRRERRKIGERREALKRSLYRTNGQLAIRETQSKRRGKKERDK